MERKPAARIPVRLIVDAAVGGLGEMRFFRVRLADIGHATGAPFDLLPDPGGIGAEDAELRLISSARGGRSHPSHDGRHVEYPERMSNGLPDRLSVNPSSRFYDGALLERGIGIRFKGVKRGDVEEYCVSEGWVRVPVRKTLDRYGQPLTVKLRGEVEPYFLDPEN